MFPANATSKLTATSEIDERVTFSVKSAALVGFILFLACVGVRGQSRPHHFLAQSDLTRENMSRVAATTGQLIAILHRDPGLMVELERWIAKDAADHGQLISDTDLTDEVIFDRLENDVAFRSVTTLLVQQYGYLWPAVNPESPLARQEDLLMQERVKWLAQEEEAERSDQRQFLVRGKNQGCDARSNSPWPSQAGWNRPCGSMPPAEAVPPGTETAPEAPGLQLSPSDIPTDDPYSPPRQSPSANDRTELLRTGNEEPTDPEQSLPGEQAERSIYGLAGEAGAGGANSPRENSQASVNPRSKPAAGFDDLLLASDSSRVAANSSPNVFTSGYSGGSDSDHGRTAAASSRYNNSLNNPIVQDSLLRARESESLNQRMIRRADPYSDIPSLYEMYVQASARPEPVERFGMRVFENGTRDLQMIPTDLPVGPEYVLGSGDGLSIDLWGGVTRRFYRIVDREGRVSLPEVGPLLVAGKSLAEVQDAVQKTLRTQFHDISADISLSRLRTIRVYVVGDALRPGAYDVGSLSTPLNALFAAGGPTSRGSLRQLKHFRGGQLLQEIDVYDLLLHGVREDIQRLENGDTVMAPPLGAQITVEGMVRRPAIYEMGGEKSLADALTLAGGLLPTATLRHIEVQRLIAHEKQTMLSLDLPQADSAEVINQQLQGFRIQDGDRIRVFPIAPYNQDAVYLEGHVIRPGKYSFREGMRVTDLIGSYKELLPEPALQYGEIVRLTLPDFRPAVQSFNLADAIADPTKAPLLQPLDTVQIFGRYDFEDPPNVAVLGDVRAPGIYRTAGDIHLSDAIHLAGGILPDAETTDAQIFRPLRDSTLKIINIRLSSALEGTPSDNILLAPRDRVLIHRNAAALDPATVYIKGEVAHPGRYPLTAGMQISDLLRAAGGLKQSADIHTADLTHYARQDEKQVSGQEQVLLAEALSGKAGGNQGLGNGDVLTIRQLPGWNDLGASITLRGEVVHPGSYGIQAGERLSSVISRAGGFSSAAYPYGCVLKRAEVQKLEQRSYGELIQRVREQQTSLKLIATSSTDPDQKLSAESALVQWQTALDDLTTTPPSGRVTIEISSNLHSWANTSRDVAVRTGDTLIVPKRPSYVLVQGQVYGPTAVAYRPGRSARWYLTQAGGATNLANRRAIFVVHADGTVIGNHGSKWLTGDALSQNLHPGDMVVVPEKAIGGPPIWKTLFQNAQILSSLTTSAILATAY
jgi:protein involved in polysaccharide export with SLBB domain